MPAYVLLSDLSGKIPSPFLIEALDDSSSGSADAAIWNQIAADVAQEINGILGQRFTVPFANPIPDIVASSAKTLACEAIYMRRGKAGKENPFDTAASDVRKLLKAIANGEKPLTPTTNRAKPSASVVTEPAATSSSSKRLSA